MTFSLSAPGLIYVVTSRADPVDASPPSAYNGPRKANVASVLRQSTSVLFRILSQGCTAMEVVSPRACGVVCSGQHRQRVVQRRQNHGR